jgi:hypothetical protein
MNKNYIQNKLVDNTIDFNTKTFHGNIKKNINLTMYETLYINNLIYNTYIKNNKITTWIEFLGIIVDYNESNIIKYLKSVNDDYIVKPQEYYINYIEKINIGLINNFGILQILDYINLYFDDEQIDSLTRKLYKIYITLFVNLNNYTALYNMLGLNFNGENESYVQNGIKNFIKKINPKEYIIPINFFFMQYKNAIPLIACMYTDIRIDVLFNSTNLFKKSYTINNLTDIVIPTTFNMDFILLEREERKKICEKQIDNLIETHNYYEQTILINSIINNDNDNLLRINFEFGINSIVKELIWDLDFYLNDYKISNKHYVNINDNNYTIFDFILNTRFYIDGARRDGVLTLSPNNYNQITKNLNQYKYHTRANNDNMYNVYSFALEPEEFQPTGAFNLNTVRVFTIEIIMDKTAVYDYIKNTNTLFNLNKLSAKINLTTIQYNFIRYQSGLSGLLFI